MSDTRPGDEAAWAEVTARWQEEEAHREYLSRLWDLEGLAEAGRRYKAVLDARPDDEVARRWRDEVVRRAAAMALAQIPRTRPPRPLPPGVRRAVIAGAVVAAAAVVGWALTHFPRAGAP
ncbi:MAG TPA: hypothetical protein VLD85_08235 [Anaeromyxobacteraceae bacterium]|nr:hypothetical protein [Anaeromyxobacteraceae bacterium]